MTHYIIIGALNASSHFSGRIIFFGGFLAELQHVCVTVRARVNDTAAAAGSALNHNEI